MAASATAEGGGRLIEGSSFHCAKHYQPFVTSDPKEWLDHIMKDNEEGKPHTYSGSAICAYCGEMKEFKREPIAANYYCPDCSEQLFQRLSKQRQERRQEKQQQQQQQK